MALSAHTAAPNLVLKLALVFALAFSCAGLDPAFAGGEPTPYPTPHPAPSSSPAPTKTPRPNPTFTPLPLPTSGQTSGGSGSGGSGSGNGSGSSGGSSSSASSQSGNELLQGVMLGMMVSQFMQKAKTQQQTPGCQTRQVKGSSSSRGSQSSSSSSSSGEKEYGAGKDATSAEDYDPTKPTYYTGSVDENGMSWCGACNASAHPADANIIYVDSTILNGPSAGMEYNGVVPSLVPASK